MLVFTSCMMYMLLADLEKIVQPLATITHIPSGTNFLFFVFSSGQFQQHILFSVSQMAAPEIVNTEQTWQK